MAETATQPKTSTLRPGPSQTVARWDRGPARSQTAVPSEVDRDAALSRHWSVFQTLRPAQHSPSSFRFDRCHQTRLLRRRSKTSLHASSRTVSLGFAAEPHVRPASPRQRPDASWRSWNVLAGSTPPSR